MNQGQPSSRNVGAVLLEQCIASDPILLEYFRANFHNPEKLAQSALELMLDGMRYRAASLASQHPVPNRSHSPPINKCVSPPPQQANFSKTLKKGQMQVAASSAPPAPPQKHYHVQYVKHKRFLSPKQCKEFITPKVTEVIPKSPQHPIYGKPKVRPDNQFGCPYHENDEQCLQNIPYAHLPCSPKNSHQMREVHVHDPYLQAQMSKSPPTNQKPSYPEDTQAPHKYYEQQQPQSGQRYYEEQYPQHQNTIVVDRIKSVNTRSPGMLKIVNSPKSQQPQEYSDFVVCESRPKKNKKTHQQQSNIESKIKFLVDRDKRNKALERDVKKQAERIRQLEKTVKGHNKTKAQKPQNDESISMRMSSDSSMTLLDTQVVAMYKKESSKRLPANEKRAPDFGISDDDCSYSQSFGVPPLDQDSNQYSESEQSFASLSLDGR